MHPTLQGASRTTSFNYVDLMNYLCTYILMVHCINTPTHPSPHSHTLVRPPPPSTTIVAHLHPLQPHHPHLFGAPYIVVATTLSSSHASAVIQAPRPSFTLCLHCSASQSSQCHHSTSSHPQTPILPRPHCKFTVVLPFTLPLTPSLTTSPSLTHYHTPNHHHHWASIARVVAPPRMCCCAATGDKPCCFLH